MISPLENYKPSAWGMRFHSLQTDDALGAGAAGPGKSLVLLVEPLSNALIEHRRCEDKKHPYHIGWGKSIGWALHLRRTFPMLKLSIARSRLLFPRFDPRAHYDPQTHTWHFSSGYRYEFGHCMDPDDWEQYQSNEYDVICFDELNQFEEEQWNMISVRNRSSDPVLRHFVRTRSMTNPIIKQEGAEKIMTRDPFWVRRKYVDPCRTGNKILAKWVKLKSGKMRQMTRIYLPATLDDNPDREFAEDYEAKLRDKPEHIRRIMLEGDWYYQVGNYFKDVYNPSIHISDPFAIPIHWKRFRSMDWGFMVPGTIGWFAVSEQDELFLERELSFQGKDADWVAERVRQIENEMGLIPKGLNRSLLNGPADTQIWEKRGDVGKTKAQSFHERGVSWIPADKKNRAANAQRIYKRLQEGSGTKTPLLVVFSTCKKTIQTAFSIVADPNDPEEPLSGGDDHWYDMLSYGCAYASRKGVGISRAQIMKRNVHRPIPVVDRGQYGYGT